MPRRTTGKTRACNGAVTGTVSQAGVLCPAAGAGRRRIAPERVPGNWCARSRCAVQRCLLPWKGFDCSAHCSSPPHRFAGHLERRVGKRRAPSSRRRRRERPATSSDGFRGRLRRRGAYRRPDRDPGVAGRARQRQTFDWSQIEVAPGGYDSRSTTRCRRRRQVRHPGLPIISARPPSRLASLRPSPIRPRVRGPGHFGAVVVKRYGPKDTFWSEARACQRPIKAVQLWNEADLEATRAASQREGVHRGAQEACTSRSRPPPGAPNSPGHAPEQDRRQAASFNPAMYKAGAKKWVDALAVKSYGRTVNAVINNIARVRAS